jgi:hypothetical protein
VATVLGHNPLNIAFYRNLTGNKWNQWLHLVLRLMEVLLSSAQEIFRWDLTTSGMFSVKTMYLDFINGHTKNFKKIYLEDKGTAKNQDFHVVLA